MLIASFVLLSLGGEKDQMEGAIKYVTLNLLSSALFLAAVGILYGTAGTLNFADLAVKLRQVDNAGLLNGLAMLFLVAFGIKRRSSPSSSGFPRRITRLPWRCPRSSPGS
jgi:multicomponent Na+:H+ antiporter subunit D